MVVYTAPGMVRVDIIDWPDDHSSDPAEITHNLATVKNTGAEIEEALHRAREEN